MIDPAAFVEANHLLTAIFGGWPSFHDAEVIAIDLWRGDVCPDRESWVGPVLTAKVVVLEATQPGAQHAGNDVLVTLRFHGVQDLRILDFNHENSIIGLSLTPDSTDRGRTPCVRVCFEEGIGINASFHCSRVEVEGVEPCSQAQQLA